MAKTYRQLCAEHQEEIAQCRAMLLQFTWGTPRTRALVADIDQALLKVQRAMERASEAPHVTRTKRVASEVALTGLERELPL